MYNRLVIDKTQDGRVAYYIYPDGYNMQNLTVDFVKQGLAGYGIADFVSDDYVAKSIEASNGLPNFVAAPVNLMYNGKKLDFKAVNYQNLTYVPVENLAKTLNTAVKVENNNATTTKGSAAVSLFSKKPYIRLTDISNIFDVNFTLNKNYTVATLTPITANAVQPVEINEVADEKDKQDTTVKQDTVKQNNVNVPKRENSLNAEKELYKSVDTKIKPEQKTIDLEKSVVDNNETDKMELVTVK